MEIPEGWGWGVQIENPSMGGGGGDGYYFNGTTHFNLVNFNYKFNILCEYLFHTSKVLNNRFFYFIKYHFYFY